MTVAVSLYLRAPDICHHQDLLLLEHLQTEPVVLTSLALSDMCSLLTTSVASG